MEAWLDRKACCPKFESCPPVCESVEEGYQRSAYTDVEISFSLCALAQVYFAKGLSFNLEILKPTEYNPQSPVGAAVAQAQDHFLGMPHELKPSELNSELWPRSLAILHQQIESRNQWRQREEEWAADTDSTLLQFVVFDSQLAKRYYEKKKIRMFSAHPSAAGMDALSELDLLLNDDSAGQVCALFDQHLIQAAVWLKQFEQFVKTLEIPVSLRKHGTLLYPNLAP